MLSSRLLVLAAALTCVACDPYRPCRDLALGQEATTLPLIPDSGDQSIVSGPRYVYASSAANFERGPVTEYVCCSLQGTGVDTSWCAPEVLECRDWPGVTIHLVGAPYTFDYESDHAQFCYVAVKAGVIVAIWSREYS